jgi:hypothetical protein
VTEQAQQPALLSRFDGFLILLLVVGSIIGWIVLGTMLFGLTSFFASFMFAWCWVNVEQGDFKQWPQCLIGAIVGIGLTWQSQFFAAQFGTPGLVTGLLIIIAAIYVQIMLAAVSLGAVYFAAVIKLAVLYATRKATA